MNTYFDQLDEILYHKLQPWLEENLSADKFATLVKKIKTKDLNENLRYNFKFYRPFNAKAEFYLKEIKSASNSCIDNVLFAINEYDNLKHQQNIYNQTINIELAQRLTDVIEIIKERHYFVEYIDPKKGNFEVNPQHKVEAYIMQLLKVALVKVYLEIQEKFNHLSNQALLNERDIYDTYFNQSLPENSFLEQVQNYATKPEPTTNKPKRSIIKPTAVSRASLTLIDFNAKSDALSNLFNLLKEHNIIAKENLLASMKWIFSGKEVASPVIWSGTESELYYFIYLIHDKYKLIKPISRNYWKVVCKCFIKTDGTQFNATTLKEAGKPSNSANIIEKAIGFLS